MRPRLVDLARAVGVAEMVLKVDGIIAPDDVIAKVVVSAACRNGVRIVVRPDEPMHTAVIVPAVDIDPSYLNANTQLVHLGRVSHVIPSEKRGDLEAQLRLWYGRPQDLALRLVP
jgi:hypothetical protein